MSEFHERKAQLVNIIGEELLKKLINIQLVCAMDLERFLKIDSQENEFTDSRWESLPLIKLLAQISGEKVTVEGDSTLIRRNRSRVTIDGENIHIS